MASDFTPHYNLDKYIATDKPNLRDQYNAAMDKIDLALLSANTNATEAKSSVLTFQGQIDGLDQDIQGEAAARASADSSLQTSIDGKASTTYVDQQRDIAIAHGRVCILIGDSYGEGYTPDGSETGWCQLAAGKLSQIGVTAKYGYLGGAGLANGAFLTKLQTVVGNMTQTEKMKCDLVVIGGGYNDRNASQGSVTSGAINIANYVRDTLPNAKVMLCFVGSCVTGRTTGSHAGATRASVMSAYRMWGGAATSCGLGFDVGAQATLDSLAQFASDYVHPNSTGLNAIAARIATLVGGGSVVNSAFQVTIPSSAWQDYSDCTVHEPKQILCGYNSDGFINAFTFGETGNAMQEFRFSSAKSATFNTVNRISVAYLRTPLTTGQTLSFPCSLTIHSTDSNIGYFTVSGRFIIATDGTCSISAMVADSRLGSGYLSTTIDKIQVVSQFLRFV